MFGYCTTCLSRNRRLQPLASLKPALESLTWFQHELDMDTGYVCWECRAMLVRIQRFQQQVLRAKRVLAQLWKASRPAQAIVGLSNLSTYTKTTFNDTMVYDEITAHNDVKTETDDYESVEYLGEDLEIMEKIESNDEIKQEFEHIVETNVSGLGEEISEPEVTERKTNLNEGGDTFLHIAKDEEKFIVTRMALEEVCKLRELQRNNERYKASPYKCVDCIKKFYFKKHYDKHMDMFHSKKQWSNVCSICTVRLPREVSLRRHHEAHFKRYRCRECDFTHHRLYDMQKHDNTEHELKNFDCKSCDKTFTSFRQLRYHRERAHKARPTCSLCGQIFSNTFNLKQHVVAIHDKALPLGECPQCGGKYRRLRAHMRTHAANAGGEDAYCAECGSQFRNVYTYRNHLRTHANHRQPGALKHSCTYCEKKFTHKTNLTRHISSIHTKTYLFHCDACSKGYHRKDRLQAHIQEKHEGVPAPKDKICPHCGKAFKDAPVLRCHIRTHTGEKPFGCTQCPWRFAQRTALNTHVRALHLRLKTDKSKKDS